MVVVAMQMHVQYIKVQMQMHVHWHGRRLSLPKRNLPRFKTKSSTVAEGGTTSWCLPLPAQ